MSVLELTGVSRTFGSLCAVDDVSLAVAAGARHAVIGPNGAGKSTLFNLIGGLLRVSDGQIRFGGRYITRLPEWRRARLGIARTFQHSSLLLNCTVLDNVMITVQRVAGRSWSMVPLTPARRRAMTARCVEALAAVGLADRAGVTAGALSHGERRQLEVAIALAAEPRLLLLDEPAAGMSPAETARLTELLRGLDRQITVVLIEHDLDLVFDIADTVTVLHLGRHLFTGTPAQARASAEVQEAYLGGFHTGDLFTTPTPGPITRVRVTSKAPEVTGRA